MKLRDALTKLCEIEQALAVEDWPVVKAWPFWPNLTPGEVIEPPCFFHTWRSVSAIHRLNAFRERNFSIDVFFALGESLVDGAIKAEACVDFDEAFHDAFAQNLMLEASNALVQNLRTEDGPTLTAIEWPPQSSRLYAGLQYTFDLKLHDQPVVGP